MPTVLDVGCGQPDIIFPAHYAGWKRVRLDIDATFTPEIVLDARQLHTLPAAQYDAVYCSHNLEHYHRHEGKKVLAGMRHVVRPEGFVEVRVPDLGAVLTKMVHDKMDIDDVLYTCGLGPILVRDVIYGYHGEIEKTGQDFFAHRTGFTAKSLRQFFMGMGFTQIVVGTPLEYELVAFGFCQKPKVKQLHMLNLPEHLAG